MNDSCKAYTHNIFSSDRRANVLNDLSQNIVFFCLAVYSLDLSPYIEY